ncbi:MAG: hypothetical protein GEU88_13195 [Solirubrobacterales bacterium]|nr:hypothetical protein [Solirubrobacterales bacterium]
MLAEHLSTEATARDRGLGFGRRHGHLVHRTVAAYELMFEEVRGLAPRDVRALGAEVGVLLAGECPDLADEIVGIADGANADPKSLFALNARTEILGGVGPCECSVIGLLPERAGGHTILAQNWDWHPDLAASRVVWTIVEPDGRWMTTLTEAGILAKIGINSDRLGLCLNLLASTDDGELGGLPIHVLCRLILGAAGDLSAAEAILERAHAGASSCFDVAHASAGGSAMAAFELSPRGLDRIEAEDGVLLHTNHFLGPMRPHDRKRPEQPDTEVRLAELERRVRDGPSRLTAEHAKQALSSHESPPIAVCCHDEDNPIRAERQATLASVCLHLDDREIEISDGAPCAASFDLVGRREPDRSPARR